MNSSIFIYLIYLSDNLINFTIDVNYIKFDFKNEFKNKNYL